MITATPRKLGTFNKYLKLLSSGIKGQQFDRSSTRSNDGQIFGPLVPAFGKKETFCIFKIVTVVKNEREIRPRAAW